MKLRESIEMPAPVEQVWAMVADPTTWPGWNPKIQTVQRHAKGPALEGEHFQATFKLGNRETPSEVEVLSIKPNVLIAVRQTYDYGQRLRSVDVAFDFEATSRGGVRVTQTLDLSRAGIPWPFRLLIGWVHRFGRRNGKGPLDELRDFFTHSRTSNPATTAVGPTLQP